MTDTLHELDAHIARVRQLPGLVKTAAPEVARVVERELRAQIARAQTPDGAPWAPRQDGGQPLEAADKALAVVAVGKRVFARLTGHIARHHKGIARGGIVRQILPGSGKLPQKLAQAVADELAVQFKKAVTGG
jgi:hypothetical protein